MENRVSYYPPKSITSIVGVATKKKISVAAKMTRMLASTDGGCTICEIVVPAAKDFQQQQCFVGKKNSRNPLESYQSSLKVGAMQYKYRRSIIVGHKMLVRCCKRWTLVNPKAAGSVVRNKS